MGRKIIRPLIYAHGGFPNARIAPIAVVQFVARKIAGSAPDLWRCELM